MRIRFAFPLRRAQLLLLLLVSPALPVCAQSGALNTYSYSPGGATGESPRLLPAPAGRPGYVLAGYGRVGFTSFFATVAHLRADLTVRTHRDYSSRPYVFTAAAHPTGYLLGGGASFPGKPYVVGLDTALAPAWNVEFTNLGSSQQYISKVLPRSATTFAAYTYTDGGDDDRFYALSGKFTGSGFRGRELLPAPAGAIGRVRVFNGIAPEARVDRHYLVGTGRLFPNPREMDGLVIKLDSNRVRWGRVLDFGRPNEAIYSLIATTDGQLVGPVVNYGFAGTINPTIVCKLDTAGTISWAREIRLGGGSLFLPLVAETSAGELVLVGSDSTTALVVVKLTAAGTLVWARRAAGTGTIGGQLTRTAAGTFLLTGSGYTIAQFDGAGNGCNLGPEFTVTVTPVTVAPGAVQSFPFTATGFAPLTSAQSLTPLAQPFTRSTVCVAVGLAEDAAAPAPLTAWPNPATGSVRLRGLPAPGELVLLDARGCVVRRQLVQLPEAELDVRGLRPGLYLARAGRRTARLLVLE